MYRHLSPILFVIPGLNRQISFLKMQCTIHAGEIASDAMMIFGGRALTKTGMGRHIQHFHQTQVGSRPSCPFLPGCFISVERRG